MKTPKKSKKDNTWLKYYINLIQINQKLVNNIANKDFDFI